jgi:succinate-acetate transporter protein
MAAVQTAAPIPTTPAGPGGPPAADYYRPPVAPSLEWANPAVVGLSGFGTTTVLAGLFVGHWIAIGSVLAMALAFGGTAQFIAGIIAMRKGEIFPGSAFMGYGAFWWSFILMLLFLPALPAAAGYALNDASLAAYMFVWFLWTLTFTIGAYKHGVGVAIVFVLLLIAFALLTWLYWTLSTGAAVSTGTLQLIGGEIVADGLVAWWTAMAILNNANFGRKVVPV